MNGVFCWKFFFLPPVQSVDSYEKYVRDKENERGNVSTCASMRARGITKYLLFVWY